MNVFAAGRRSLIFICSLMLGMPAAAAKVGIQSISVTMSLICVPGFTTPGQRTIIGMRKPPSQVVPFSPWNGVMAPSGHKRHLGAVVGRVEHDGVVGDAEIVELLQKLADMPVMLDHAVGMNALAGLADALRLEMGEDMHAGRVEPDEERLVRPVLAVDEVLGRREELLVDGFHALGVERPGVLDLAVGIGA